MAPTDVELVSLEPGPLMDLKVALACNFKATMHAKSDGRPECRLNGSGNPWEPSRIKHHAIIAAERFRLFDYPGRKFYLGQEGGDWIVYESEWHDQPGWFTHSPCMTIAICLAILKIAKEPA